MRNLCVYFVKFIKYIKVSLRQFQGQFARSYLLSYSNAAAFYSRLESAPRTRRGFRKRERSGASSWSRVEKNFGEMHWLRIIFGSGTNLESSTLRRPLMILSSPFSASFRSMCPQAALRKVSGKNLQWFNYANFISSFYSYSCILITEWLWEIGSLTPIPYEWMILDWKFRLGFRTLILETIYTRLDSNYLYFLHI